MVSRANILNLGPFSNTFLWSEEGLCWGSPFTSPEQSVAFPVLGHIVGVVFLSWPLMSVPGVCLPAAMCSQALRLESYTWVRLDLGWMPLSFISQDFHSWPEVIHFSSPTSEILLFCIFDNLYQSVEDLDTHFFFSEQNGTTQLLQIEFCSISQISFFKPIQKRKGWLWPRCPRPLPDSSFWPGLSVFWVNGKR